MLPSPSLHASLPPSIPRIVAVGFRRINKLLQELAPEFADRAAVEVLDMGFDQAVARVRELQRQRPVDVIVAAGSNGAYLRQRLDTPVVLVKVGGFDLMQALTHARRLSARIGLVTYEGMAPDITQFDNLFAFGVSQRSYRTEEEAQACVRELQQQGIEVVVGSGVVADLADQHGMTGIFLYSIDAVRGALEDAVEVARASRIEQAKRERLSTILAQLSDGVIAVDRQEHILTLNPTMAQWLGVTAEQWLGRRLSEVCPELSLQHTLRLGAQDLERIERVKGKTLIVNRIPLIEQGVLTGALLSSQDPISIQRVDRHIRTRIKPQAQHARYELHQLIGHSQAIARVQRMASSCARSQATVLLIGESGTGKEVVAQGIHMASDRRDMPFVAVNCAAVSESLLESELFGYEEGAFTGARRGGKIGLFEAAHNGTIFLDEVGEMPLSLQTRLLRVLQEREVLRVGATEPTPVNVRVIAATHRDLASHVAEGRFRQDLFYRLNILRIDMPALRERAEDVPELAQALHGRVCARLGLHPSATLALLGALIEQSAHYPWPGNVRELENLIERLVAYAASRSEPIPAWQLAGFVQDTAPELFMAPTVAVRPSRMLTAGPMPAPSTEPRRPVSLAEIQRVLQACEGDKGRAAQQLGMSRTTLWRKLREA
ncbi:MAG: propionate catabolism operon regulatory protein PrpR [Aquabacterium sp.]|uniref:propionate catabolism operon regulatory protein PrpR n=1 Tax=Aquabacterium sp. TaxID=1872578 RepID=UPI003BD46F9A